MTPNNRKRARMMRFLNLLVILTALFALQQLQAKSMWRPQFGPPPFPIQVSVLRTFGDGCPQGTVSAAVTPDQTTVSLLFDQLLTDVPASPSPLVVRRSCNVTLSVRFPGQYRVAIVGSDINGFVHIPAGATSSISVKHWSIYDMGGRLASKMNIEKRYVGPVEENVQMLSRFPDVPLWSQCGTQFRGPMDFPFMTINIDINSTNQNPAENLLAAIDSMDFSASGLTYHLAWTPDTKSCPR